MERENKTTVNIGIDITCPHRYCSTPVGTFGSRAIYCGRDAIVRIEGVTSLCEQHIGILITRWINIGSGLGLDLLLKNTCIPNIWTGHKAEQSIKGLLNFIFTSMIEKDNIGK